jgi:hypothetical protein
VQSLKPLREQFEDARPARWNRTTLGSGLQPRRIPDVSG